MFMQFDNFEDALDWMQQSTAEANAILSDKQRAVTFGDHWVRFYPTGGSDILLILGYCEPLAYWDRHIAECGKIADSNTRRLEIAEWQQEKDTVIASHGDGYLFGKAYSVIEPTGEWGSTHSVNVWPIDQTIFDAGRRAGWQFDKMDRDAQNAVMDAWAEYRDWAVATHR